MKSGPRKTDKLLAVLERLAQGQYDSRCEVSPGQDGLDDIAASVNALAEELQRAVTGRTQAETELRRLTQTLENKIDPGTSALREGREAGDALQKSENLFKRTVEYTPSAICLKDLEGRYRMVNQRFGEWYARAPEEFIGLETHDIFPGPIADQIVARDRAVAGGGEISDGEMEVPFADGTRHILTVTKFPVRDSDGKIIGVGTVNTDITERKKIEEGLRKSEANLARAQAIAHLGNWERYLETGEGTWSDEMFRLLGRDPDTTQPSQQAFLAAVHPEDKARVRANMDAMIAIGADYDYEYRIVRPDGEVRHLQSVGQVEPGPGGQALRVFGTLLDITARKQAEEALARSERQLADAIENIPDGFALYDSQDRLVVCNEAYRGTYPKHADLLTPGSRFEDMLRAGVYRGEFSDAVGREEEWISERLETHANPPGPIEQKLSDGRWLRLEERRTRDGGIVGIRTDITELKRAEEEIRASEERFRNTFDHSPSIISVKDLQGRFTLVNKRFEEWLKVRREDAIGKTSHDVYPSEFAEFFLSQDQEVLLSGKPVVWEATVPFRDGKIRTIVNTKFPIYGPGGDVVSIGSLGTDITERKQAEEALVANQRLLQTLFDTIPHSLFLKDLDGRFLMVNPILAARHGLDPEQLVGRPISDFPVGTPEQIQRLETIDGSILNGEQGMIRHEITLTQGAGQDTTFRRTILPFHGEGNKLEGLVGIAEDITEQIQAEKALRESEERFRSTVENLPTALVLKDLEGRFVYVNPLFESWWGISREQALGKTSHDLFDKEDADLYTALDKEVIGTQTVQEREYSVRFADGTEHVIIAAKYPIQGADGNTTGVGVVLSDITVQRLVEAQLRQSQKMEAIGQLAGGVAHDFNNMLQVIQGYTKLSLGDDTLSENTRDYLTQVQGASTRAASLTQQLLTFGRQQMLDKKIFDITHMIENQLNLLRRVIHENIDLELIPYPTVLPVYADAGMIEQALVNLCINARDAMPDGGRLTIQTRSMVADPDFCALHSWARPGAYALISVSDTGSGMTPEVMGRIFDPFFTTKELGKGTGLGLSMVYGIIQQHEGHIAVRSVPGGGATFEIYLPATDDFLQTAEENAVEQAEGGQETILLAEDEKEVLELVVALLERAGYTVMTASNGEEALEAFSSQSGAIDLVMLDVVMPKMGGPQVMEKIRTINPDIPVLFTTGYAPDSSLLKEYREPRVKIIRKPYAPNELYSSLRQLIAPR